MSSRRHAVGSWERWYNTVAAGIDLDLSNTRSHHGEILVEAEESEEEQHQHTVRNEATGQALVTSPRTANPAIRSPNSVNDELPSVGLASQVSVRRRRNPESTLRSPTASAAAGSSMTRGENTATTPGSPNTDVSALVANIMQDMRDAPVDRLRRVRRGDARRLAADAIALETSPPPAGTRRGDGGAPTPEAPRSPARGLRGVLRLRTLR